MPKCRNCGKEIIWLKKAGKDKTAPDIGAKSNPIEAEPHPNGKLVINRELGLYRFATGNELEMQKYHGRPLYISHFETCPGADSFRSGKASKPSEPGLFE